MPDRAQNVDVLRSRLGRKIVLMILGAGAVPLIALLITFHFEARAAILDESERVMQGYARLAAGQIERTLDLAGDKLARATESGSADPFIRLVALDSAGRPASETALTAALALEELPASGNGRVRLTRPFTEDGATTIALVARRGDGYLAGIIDPHQVWDAARGSNFGPHDLLVVTDTAGVVLASSAPVDSTVRTPPEFFAAERIDGQRTSGVGSFPGMSPVIWARQELRSPLFSAQGGWSVLMMRKLGVVEDTYLRMYRLILFYLLPAMAFLFLLSMRFARRLNAPIEDLTRTARELARGNWAARAPVTRSDEVGELARTFNAMAEEINRHYRERLRLENDAVLGRIASSIAHEVNNPLAAILTRFSLLKKQLPSSDAVAVASMKGIEEQIDRITRTIQHLMDSSDRRFHSRELVSVSHLFAHAVSAYEEPFRLKDLRLVRALEAAPLHVSADGEGIRSILKTLLDHLLRILPSGVTVRMSGAATTGADSREWIEIAIAHDGPPLGESLETLFRPFQTPRPGVMELNLALARRIAEDHQGTLTADDPVEGGARFTLRLPRVRPAPERTLST